MSLPSPASTQICYAKTHYMLSTKSFREIVIEKIIIEKNVKIGTFNKRSLMEARIPKKSK